MHHRRKPGKRNTARGRQSRITTLRLPYQLEAAIKREAESRGQPWQTVLKALLAEALGLGAESAVEVSRVSADGLKEARDRLGGKP